MNAALETLKIISAVIVAAQIPILLFTALMISAAADDYEPPAEKKAKNLDTIPCGWIEMQASETCGYESAMYRRLLKKWSEAAGD